MVTRKELVELLATDQTQFFYNNFSYHDHISSAVTQTGAVTFNQNSCLLETGIQSGSVARIYYTNPVFNPKFSILQIKSVLSSMKDCEVFLGFFDATLHPSSILAEPQAVFYVNGGNVYAVTGSTTAYQRTQISDVDWTNNFLFKIENYNFYTRPLPIRYPFFDGFRTEIPSRSWTLGASNSKAPPEDQYYSIVAQIKNTTGENKTLELKHITYSEEYAD